MTGIHNLQIIISQMPRVTKINEADGIANGARIINVVTAEKRVRQTKKVRQLSEIEPTEKEDPQKRKLKKQKKIDLFR